MMRTISCCVLVLLFSACRTVSTTAELPDAWSSAFNGQTDELRGHYTASPVLSDPANWDERYTDTTALYAALAARQDQLGPLRGSRSEHRLENRPDLHYEIRTLYPRRGRSYRQLLILREQEGQWLRELEITAPVDGAPLDTAGIRRAREEWMRWCNAHQPAELVQRVYHPLAVYYNHKPLVVGTQAITAEYQYMARPNYRLQLAPLALIAVNKELAYEIGQCSGSYELRYIIVWNKMADGRWVVRLDSNY